MTAVATPPIDVLASGAVLLGRDVVCDGFHMGPSVRVQTHVHDDHMEGFESSKGFQDLVMSEATLDLLIAEFNADLTCRTNLFSLKYGAAHATGRSKVTLYSSGHMLGSAQVLVETDGMRLGYSGDFAWPLEPADVMQCDALVVDSTYGSPDNIRHYSQEEAETSFLDLVHARIKRGPVYVAGHRGTIHRALHLLGENVKSPIICSKNLRKEISVYQQHAAAVCSVLEIGTPECDGARRAGPYVRFYSKGDRYPPEPPTGVSCIKLGGYLATAGHPLMEYSDRSYRVALSNHADFNGTVDYVRATGAKYVVTDNTRGYGVQLAMELRQRLGVVARPSDNASSFSWGF